MKIDCAIWYKKVSCFSYQIMVIFLSDKFVLYVLTVCYYHAFIVDRCFVVCFFRNLKRSTAFAENLLIVILVVAVYTQREKKPHYRQTNKSNLAEQQMKGSF